MRDEDDEDGIGLDEDEGDAILVNLIPRKANPWILVTIFLEFLRNVSDAVAYALKDLTTVAAQRYNYEEERKEWHQETAKEIENLQGFYIPVPEEPESKEEC